MVYVAWLAVLAIMPPPNVTGLSPREGRPGRTITIRGENLGNNANDVLSKLKM